MGLMSSAWDPLKNAQRNWKLISALPKCSWSKSYGIILNFNYQKPCSLGAYFPIHKIFGNREECLTYICPLLMWWSIKSKNG